MGNCQAIDAATVVVQHPCGKVDKFYWAVSASEIMRMNPGHYVALLISTTLYHNSDSTTDKHKCPDSNVNPVRLTRIKLLRPTDTLVLGQVYRLITTQEVMKGLSAKKHAKMKKNHQESAEKPYDKAGLRPETTVATRSEADNKEINKVSKHERHRPRSTTSANSTTARSKTWQPSLQSISEAAS